MVCADLLLPLVPLPEGEGADWWCCADLLLPLVPLPEGEVGD